MLRRFKEMQGVKLQATDGDVGSLNDFYFDDETWTARYLVVDTGVWLGRLVVISPVSLATPDWNGKRIPVNLSRREIENSPDILELPHITRQVEADYAAYYGYPFYWGGPELWGWAGYPGALASASPPPGYLPPVAEIDASVTAVYSGREVTGYHIQATDGEIGHIDDFLIEDGSWGLRYLQVDTSNWIGGRTVLIATPWISRLDPADGKIHVDLARELIANAPEYNPKQPITREYEERLHYHYGQAGYWERTVRRARGASASPPA
jgi:PRC-barrel domain